MKTKYQVTPNDSRYVPFTQQKYDCAPTSIMMIMYRNGIPLMSTEELGYRLGLVVPPKDKALYCQSRVFDKIVNGKIRIIDTWYNDAKWQLFEPDLMYRAIQKHGSDKSGGIWRFTKNV
ncbi:MAG: hypothetical protein LBK50_02215 [Candidatus Nomurabacteria bacterium]|jgi:hypothetical protein|nr:hypothetical protein [Candidatus Nomurabacteria bacterium]